MSRYNRGCILVNCPYSAILNRGLERINCRSPARADILYDRRMDDPEMERYSWTLELEQVDAPAAPVNISESLAADAWAIEVRGTTASRIFIQAGSERARLYALYHIAESLENGKPPSEWAIERRPLLPKRYAWPSAGSAFNPAFRPDQYKRDIEELPALGLNGVLITYTPTHGTHYGRDTIPFSLTKNGVAIDSNKLPVFRCLFDELKSYGLDIWLFHQAFTPPPFTSGDVRNYYNGTIELPGFNDAVEQSSHDLAEALFTHLPQVNGLLFHSLECEWMWGDAVSIFPCKNDRAAGGAFEAYLRGMSLACETHKKDLMYWTHVSGISARQIRLQHKLLAKFPGVMTVEDHAWPNNMWPFAPVMGHLSEDLRSETASSRFGLSIDTTDGEYYGGGALPTAYPDPHIRCGKAAVELGAEMSFVRFNQQALTPLGTLDDINAIHVIATAEQWWANPRTTDQLWREWCAHRFGAAAAPAVESAVRKSGTIMTKGFSAAKMPLIDHSTLSVSLWHPLRRYGAWDVFARPDTPLVEKPWDELTCEEIRCWQVKAHGVELNTYLRDSDEAATAAHEALREIAAVRDCLAPDDFAYLTACFEDAVLVLEAIRCTAVAACASSRLHQIGGTKERQELQKACAAMEACADRIESKRGKNFCPAKSFMTTRLKGLEYKGYGVPIGLRAIAEVFMQVQSENKQ